MAKLIALVDCNNFYASCERVFNPALNNKPVVVLSNNDGCVIARSNEVKALGIAMGEPIFKVKNLVERHQIKVYSANFVLYGDMSRRVMNTLSQFTNEMEIYSIDESFLSIDGFEHFDLSNYVQKIRNKVKQNTGLPVSIGVAPTKTLAKLANRVAKKLTPSGGTFSLTNEKDINHWLEKTDVENIWGIGKEKATFLKRQGIENAYQLQKLPDQWIKKNLTIITLKTVQELRGVSCLPFEDIQPDKKAIGTSRTFGHDVYTLIELQEAVVAYVAKACEKLRSQRSVCGYLQVFIASNPFGKSRYYSNACGVDISPPTAYTPQMAKVAKGLLERIYRPEFSYKRAGVLLTNLMPENAKQEFLFDETYQDSPQQHLMRIIDKHNRSSNSGKIFLAAEGISKPWYMKQIHKSSRFTTRWNEILEVNI